MEGDKKIYNAEVAEVAEWDKLRQRLLYASNKITSVRIMKPGIRLFRKYFTDISSFIWFTLYCFRVPMYDNIITI